MNRKFMEERKRSLCEELKKVELEYSSISEGLEGLVIQARQNVNSLVSQTDKKTFRKALVPVMRQLQETLNTLVSVGMTMSEGMSSETDQDEDSLSDDGATTVADDESIFESVSRKSMIVSETSLQRITEAETYVVPGVIGSCRSNIEFVGKTIAGTDSRATCEFSSASNVSNDQFLLNRDGIWKSEDMTVTTKSVSDNYLNDGIEQESESIATNAKLFSVSEHSLPDEKQHTKLELCSNLSKQTAKLSQLDSAISGTTATVDKILAKTLAKKCPENASNSAEITGDVDNNSNAINANDLSVQPSSPVRMDVDVTTCVANAGSSASETGGMTYNTTVVEAAKSISQENNNICSTKQNSLPPISCTDVDALFDNSMSCHLGGLPLNLSASESTEFEDPISEHLGSPTFSRPITEKGGTCGSINASVKISELDGRYDNEAIHINSMKPIDVVSEQHCALNKAADPSEVSVTACCNYSANIDNIKSAKPRTVDANDNCFVTETNPSDITQNLFARNDSKQSDMTTDDKQSNATDIIAESSNLREDIYTATTPTEDSENSCKQGGTAVSSEQELARNCLDNVSPSVSSKQVSSVGIYGQADILVTSKPDVLCSTENISGDAVPACLVVETDGTTVKMNSLTIPAAILADDSVTAYPAVKSNDKAVTTSSLTLPAACTADDSQFDQNLTSLVTPGPKSEYENLEAEFAIGQEYSSNSNSPGQMFEKEVVNASEISVEAAVNCVKSFDLLDENTRNDDVSSLSESNISPSQKPCDHADSTALSEAMLPADNSMGTLVDQLEPANKSQEQEHRQKDTAVQSFLNEKRLSVDVRGVLNDIPSSKDQLASSEDMQTHVESVGAGECDGTDHGVVKADEKCFKDNLVAAIEQSYTGQMELSTELTSEHRTEQCKQGSATDKLASIDSELPAHVETISLDGPNASQELLDGNEINAGISVTEIAELCASDGPTSFRKDVVEDLKEQIAGTSEPSHKLCETSPNYSQHVQEPSQTGVSLPKDGKVSNTDAVGINDRQNWAENMIIQPRSIVSDSYGLGPPIERCRLKSGEWFQGVIVEILNPWMFWLQIITKNQDLENLLQRIAFHYKKQSSSSTVGKLPSEPRVGMIVCARYQLDKCWYRARIIYVYPDTSSEDGKTGKRVMVRFVDFGNSELIRYSRLRPLDGRFAELPCQAFLASLSCVGPVDGSCHWHVEQKLKFADLSRDKSMSKFINVRAVSDDVHNVSIDSALPCPAIFVELLDPSAPSGPGARAETLGDNSRNRSVEQWLNQGQKSQDQSPAVNGTDIAYTFVESGSAVWLSSNRTIADWYRAVLTGDEIEPGSPRIMYSEDLLTQRAIVSDAKDGLKSGQKSEDICVASDGGINTKANGRRSESETPIQASKSYDRVVKSEIAATSVTRSSSRTQTNSGKITCENNVLLGSVSNPSSNDVGALGCKGDELYTWNVDHLWNKKSTESPRVSQSCLKPAAAATGTAVTVTATGTAVAIVSQSGDTSAVCSEGFATAVYLEKTAVEIDSRQHPNNTLHTEGQPVAEMCEDTDKNSNNSCGNEDTLRNEREEISTKFTSNLAADMCMQNLNDGKDDVNRKTPEICASSTVSPGEDVSAHHVLAVEVSADGAGDLNCQTQHVEPEPSATIAPLLLIVPQDKKFHVAISHVESPGSFWVHLVNEDIGLLDNITRALNHGLSQETPGIVSDNIGHSRSEGMDGTGIDGLESLMEANKCAADDKCRVELELKWNAACAGRKGNDVTSDSKSSILNTCHSNISLATDVSLTLRDERLANVSNGEVGSSVHSSQSDPRLDSAKQPTGAASRKSEAASQVSSKNSSTVELQPSTAITGNSVPTVAVSVSTATASEPAATAALSTCSTISTATTSLKKTRKSAIQLLLGASGEQISLKPMDKQALVPGVACSARSTEDDLWYRAEILELERCTDEEKQILVWYIDFGNSEWLPVSRVMALPRCLAALPPLAVCCRLAGVSPMVNGQESRDWSVAATELFINLTGSGATQLVFGFLDKKLESGSIVSPTLSRPLELLLVWGSEDESGVSDDSERVVIMSRELIRRGHACQPDDAGMENWNPMAEDYLSIRNSLQVNDEDAGTAAGLYNTKDEERICRYFGTKKGCYRGDDCLFEHVSPRDHYDPQRCTTDRREVFCPLDTEMSIDMPQPGLWTFAQVSNIVDPSNFHIILPYGTKSIKDLQSRPASYNNDDISCSLVKLTETLNTHYSHKTYSDSDLVVYSEGEIVVARFTHDERWHRAKIIECDPDLNKYQMLCVDYHCYSTVKAERIRQMEPSFMLLPFQAIQCRLPVQPAPDKASAKSNSNTLKWSSTASECFWSAVHGKVLVTHVLDRPGLLDICVDLYDGDQNISSVLVEEGFAVRTDRLESGSTCSSSRSQKLSSSGGSVGPSNIIVRPG